jgi:hypothetical protein
VTSPNYVQTVLNLLHAKLLDLDPDLARLYALLALTKGMDTSMEDVHDAWALWRNTTNPDHRSLIPFAELADEEQELDREYAVAIHAAARWVTA